MQKVNVIKKEDRVDTLHYIREHGKAMLSLLIPMFPEHAKKVLERTENVKKYVDKQQLLT